MERASAAHDHRLRPRQRHEHGSEPRGLRDDLPGDRPAFRFPGSAQQWEGLTDVTDARVLARHLEWAATSDAGRNQAFNIVNGDIFRWRWLWPRLAADFGIEPAAYPGRPTPLEPQLADAGAVWAEIAAKHGLAEPDLGKLESAWQRTWTSGVRSRS